MATKDVTHDSFLPSKVIDDVENKVQSVSLGKATQEEKNFTFEVNKGAVLGQADKSYQSYPAFQVSNKKVFDLMLLSLYFHIYFINLRCVLCQTDQ